MSNTIATWTIAYTRCRFDQNSETNPATIAPSNRKSSASVQSMTNSDP